MAAAGHLQLGNSGSARQFTRLAQDWGCSKKLISQILIAGVHNTLGRAAAIMGQESRVWKHFHQSIALGNPGSDARLLAPARAAHQLLQIGYPGTESPRLTLNALNSPLFPHTLHLSASSNFHVKKLAKFDLGDAWTSNTINTVIFRHHAVITLGEYQYTAFYADKHTLRLVKRDLIDNTLQSHDISAEYNLNDAHNSISLGYDRQGHLHLTYDHHGTQLRYRRGMVPYSIVDWTDELPMTGQNEEQVTYPTFLVSAQGTPLMLLYRNGSHKNGDALLKVYDDSTCTWSDREAPVLSGSGQKPWTSNGYWNHPVYGTDGSLHLSFVWRTQEVGEAKLINNVNICYARSMDGGLTWSTSLGQPYNLPITPVTCETVHPVSPGSKLINQCGMALDSHNRPHIVFYANDAYGIPQYQHLCFDGIRWRHQVISRRTSSFQLKGSGTLPIPISRPEIVVDRYDNAYVIYRGDLTENRLVVQKLHAPDYQYDPALVEILWDEDVGYAEPVIDRLRWQAENVLSVLIQHNQQPVGDCKQQLFNAAVFLVDFKFNDLGNVGT